VRTENVHFFGTAKGVEELGGGVALRTEGESETGAGGGPLFTKELGKRFLLDVLGAY